MEMVEKAIEFAAKAHEGQYRKASDLPYIVHPYAVAMMLLKEGCRKEVVAAALLHDTVEDTAVTNEEIKAEFGSDVARIVEACTEPPKNVRWEERKQHTIERLKTAEEEICMLICADKLHNLKTIHEELRKSGESVWHAFSRGKEKQEWYYRKIAETIALHHSFPLLEQLQSEIKQVFGVIRT
ncbi:HD domain-containing protein [Heyndrickxia coagulans]|uniref:HD domain-containing protein n=1 Tax=Heyndrickxia coagulans TaxID=1398 RepID=UPI00145949D7|nr:HD domain-containing protein [Heyndrickxia coagulans]NMH84193.1 bifunctional (p)ppGpp synthetase/guanosine-3',5'-bis(diphosphate) 3'-pyrophosphohydrolase [Heyndrickxia coagulans]